ncbi:MAG: glycosyltransferase family 9 protein [Candidatus Omnitrophota bacterium]|nr:glycosyltransferase family 9 protein [Candidatus Omnitrophota bacterium]
MKPKRILLIRTDRLGDVVLSTPAVKALREAYPGSYIAFMVRPYTKDIVEGNPYLDEVIIYDKYGIQRGFLATLLFALKLRKKKFDTAIVLHPTNRAHIIAFMAGIHRRIGFNKKLPFLLTDAIRDEKYLGQKHELEYTLDILKNIGVEVRDKNLYVRVKKKDEDSIASKLAENGVSSSDLLIAVHPGASCSSKRWPAERFASLIDKIKGNYDVCIILISGPEDVCRIAKLEKEIKSDIINLSGRTSVGEITALLKRCKLFISNDSGPVHIAAAVGTANIVIFGRKQPGLGPRRWGPRGEGDITLHEDAGCGICLAHNCKNGFKCLEAITVDEVFAAVKEMLDKK